jgi:hypothetical protein
MVKSSAAARICTPTRDTRKKTTRPAHRPRAEDQKNGVLHEIGDREGGDQQGRRAGLAQRPEGDPLHAEGEDGDDDDGAQGHDHHRIAGQRVDHEAAHHDQLAMGEVDQAHDAEDEADAERGQGIDRAQADRVDQVLDDDHARPRWLEPK